MKLHAPRIHFEELTDFITGDDLPTFWTDRTKAKIMCQFLIKFRQQFDTDLEFAETVSEVIDQFKIQN